MREAGGYKRIMKNFASPPPTGTLQSFSLPDSSNHPGLLSALALMLPLSGMPFSIFAALFPPSQHFSFSGMLPSQRSDSREAKIHLICSHFLTHYLILFSSMYPITPGRDHTYLFTCWSYVSPITMEAHECRTFVIFVIFWAFSKCVWSERTKEWI